MKVFLDQQNDKSKILAKAAIKAAEILDLTDDEFLKILKIKRSSIAQLKNFNLLNLIFFDEEIAILFISIFNLLHKLSGGDVDLMCYFMRSYNYLTGGIPIKQIQSSNGLVKIYKELGNISEKTFRS